MTYFKVRTVTAAALMTLLGANMAHAQVSPAEALAQIPTDSPLLNIDPTLVQCGRYGIDLMDATRITTTWENQKFPAFKVIGNTYSVGIKAVTSFIIKTSDGLILIDTTFAETAPWVGEGIEELGFDLADIKIILGSHAHGDHQGGNQWFMERAPNAKLMIMEADADTVEAGTDNIPATSVDRRLKDGEVVTLGDVNVKVWNNAGHTPGTTTLEWETVDEDGKVHTVVVVGSQQAVTELVPEKYAGVVADQIDGWERLLTLQPSVWFGGHTWQHNGIDKYEALLVDPSNNEFIDPQGYKCLIAARAYDFVNDLKAQVAAGEATPSAQ